MDRQRGVLEVSRTAREQNDAVHLAGSLDLSNKLEQGWSELQQNSGLCRRVPHVTAGMVALPQHEWEPNEHGIPTVTVDSIAAFAGQNKCAALVLVVYVHQPARTDVATEAEAYQNQTLWISNAFTTRLGAPDPSTGIEWVNRSVHGSVALRYNTQGLIKSLLMGDYSQLMIRTMMYHDDKPAEPQLMWFLPCIVRHQGTVYKYAHVGYVAGEEARVHLYESVMHDHLGLKFTPVIINMVDLTGFIIHQNAASMAAFGLQGMVHRAEGSSSGFNLLDELFGDDVAQREEMVQVTSGNNMFSTVLALRSSVLRKWLGVGTRDAYHQVQVSRARCAVTQQYMYVVAQVDVTASVLAEHQVVRLQAENQDLHWTTAWLEDQKAQTDEVNQRLKASLESALAARDGPLRSVSIDTDSPADKAIKLLNRILEGQDVSPREALAVRDVILQAGRDLLQPVNFKQQMGAQMGGALDEEVGQSLIDLLVTKRDMGTGDEIPTVPDTGGLSDPPTSGPLPSAGVPPAVLHPAVMLNARSRSASLAGSVDGEAIAGLSGRALFPCGNNARGWSGGGILQAYHPIASTKDASGQGGTTTGEQRLQHHYHKHYSSHAGSTGIAAARQQSGGQPAAASLMNWPCVEPQQAQGTGQGQVEVPLPVCRSPQNPSLSHSTGEAGTEASGSTGSTGSQLLAPGVRSTSATPHVSLPSPQGHTRPGSAFLAGGPMSEGDIVTSMQRQQHASGCSNVEGMHAGQHSLPVPAACTSPQTAQQARSALQHHRRSLGLSCDAGTLLTAPPHLSLPAQRAQHVGRSAQERAIASSLLYICRSPPDHLAPLLTAADEWGWDAWALHEASGGRPLSCLAFYLLNRYHAEALRACSVDTGKLCRFLVRAEDDYLDNSYHNRVHAADVLQWTHMLMTHGGVLRPLNVGHIGTLACYLAAVVHDLNHKGVNNDFLVRSQDPLALLYNDQSPMESHHLALTFQLLAQEPYNFLAEAPAKLRQMFRKQVITMVLATDMKQHFTQTSLFKSRLGVTDDEAPAATAPAAPAAPAAASSPVAAPAAAPAATVAPAALVSPAAAAPSAATAPAVTQGPASTSGTPESMTPQPSAASFVQSIGPHSNSGSGVLQPNAQLDEETKAVVLSVALKCADLGNLAAPHHVNLRWVEQLQEEYFMQGDRESSANLPLSALMDRTKAGVSKSQSGFFSIVGLPLFRVFTKAFPGTRPMLDAANRNYEWWHNLEEEAIRRAATDNAGGV